MEPVPRRDDHDPAVARAATGQNPESVSSAATALGGSASELAGSTRWTSPIPFPHVDIP